MMSCDGSYLHTSGLYLRILVFGMGSGSPTKGIIENRRKQNDLLAIPTSLPDCRHFLTLFGPFRIVRQSSSGPAALLGDLAMAKMGESVSLLVWNDLKYETLSHMYAAKHLPTTCVSSSQDLKAGTRSHLILWQSN